MNILITGAWQFSADNIRQIEELGHKVMILQYERDPIPYDYKDIDAVICNGLFLYHPIEKFKNLKYIQLTSAGYDRVPMEYVKENNIQIYNAKGVYSIPIAEYVVMSILNLYKNAFYFRKNQEKHLWIKNRNILELNNKVVAILGVGSIGHEIAKRLKAFNTKNIGFDIKVFKDEYFDNIYSINELKEYVDNVDIIISCLPLVESTKNIIDTELFEKVKSDLIVVNISRGGVINEESLMKFIKEKKIFGAILDVFEEEPFDKDSELWNLENIIITPHNSFVSDKNNERLGNLIINNLISIREE